MSQRDFEAKRNEFRTYLERTGIVDALTKILIALYEETERPKDALEYVCKYLGEVTQDTGEVHTLKKKLEEAKNQLAELQAKLVKLNLEEASV